ncbi:uncharacterized protein LOC130655182 [Hydractinia symbiolongicarpus]|uniref:uncharacterized protein LOC130655129 n=1 Tax=Hydractinia symbiolongicarpus TaxID=13093 RepID=UPI00254E8054|nr:uncharacterized protein LOC130655129 [Hydractinia symbiolongicarpus]XP_057313886.1 uncharacterized protein LOC130655182 [Hydractinia symbiolongicarpus]
MVSAFISILIITLAFVHCEAHLDNCPSKCQSDFSQCIAIVQGEDISECNKLKTVCYQKCSSALKRRGPDANAMASQSSNKKNKKCWAKCKLPSNVCSDKKKVPERQTCRNRVYLTCLSKCILK